MTRCRYADCHRRPIDNGPYCDEHTRAVMTNAFAPEWVRRAREKRLPTKQFA